MQKLLISYVVSLLWLSTATASDTLELSIGKWSFDGIDAQALQFDINLNKRGLVFDATAKKLALPEPIGTLSNVHMQCQQLIIAVQQFSCASGSVRFNHKDLGQQSLQFELIAKPEQQYYKLKLSNLDLATSISSFDIDWHNGQWHVAVSSPKTNLSSLIEFITPFTTIPLQHQLQLWSLAGESNIQLQLNGNETQLNNAKVELTSNAIDINDQSGRYVSEQLGLHLIADTYLKQQTLHWQLVLALNKGQAYAEPIYLDLDSLPLSLQVRGEWQQQNQLFKVSNVSLKQTDVLNLQGQFSLQQMQLDQVDVSLSSPDLTLLYQNWLQPYLTGTTAESLDVAGKMDVKVNKDHDDFTIQMTVDDVVVDDQAERFGMGGITGNFSWTNTDKSVTTSINWQHGHLYNIPIGQSAFNATIQNSSLTLDEPWQLPILDGELHINEFSLNNPEDETMTWSFDGVLSPISMASLSETLNWPLLHGKLSGVIPQVSYSNHAIEMQGALMVKLFDGTTVIRDLRLGKPFGVLPQLYANIDIFKLDLETLTRTFDFGKITGKLDGTIKNLRLANWKPVQFDATILTPQGDKSRRRISQKAVDNLSQIGGGAGGVLSRSFLRFFEDFSYQRLGLNCQLRNDVCHMSGVAEAEQGYYIVKGGGLPPRINVIGYTRQVDWSDLIGRLKAVSNSSGPVVQ